MFIRIKGHEGNYNAIVTGFYKNNLDYLKRKIPVIYAREYGEEIPAYFNSIKTVKDLKNFVKVEMNDMDTYPFGFKYMDGILCLYECLG